MEWTKDRVRELRLRMGWSQSDLARHLNTELTSVLEIEKGQTSAFEPIKPQLNLFWHQAESLSEELRMMSLVEKFMDSENRIQAFTSELSEIHFEGTSTARDKAR